MPGLMMNTPLLISSLIRHAANVHGSVEIVSARSDGQVHRTTYADAHRRQSIAALVLFLTDVHALGLDTTQGLLLTTAFYWDRTDETRKWSKRFFDRMKRMPTDAQAGDYSSTLHYLKSIQAAGTDEAGPVMAKMKATPINDMFATNGRIREDGRMIHDMYLAQVKSPAESKTPWDYFKIKAVIPAAEAFQPLSKSTCPLVNKPK